MLWCDPADSRLTLMLFMLSCDWFCRILDVPAFLSKLLLCFNPIRAWPVLDTFFFIILELEIGYCWLFMKIVFC